MDEVCAPTGTALNDDDSMPLPRLQISTSCMTTVCPCLLTPTAVPPQVLCAMKTMMVCPPFLLLIPTTTTGSVPQCAKMTLRPPSPCFFITNPHTPPCSGKAVVTTVAAMRCTPSLSPFLFLFCKLPHLPFLFVLTNVLFKSPSSNVGCLFLPLLPHSLLLILLLDYFLYHN